MDLFSNQCRLDHLPVELLEMIVSLIQGKAALKSISCVSRLFRQLCAPVLFKVLHVGFSNVGLDRILDVSESPLAHHVKVIHYNAPALVDPLAANWDTFCACLYTPAEFAQDRRNLYRQRGGSGLSYRLIFSYFRQRCEEQQKILQQGRDTRALVTSLPYFSNLCTLRLSYVDGIEDQFEWLANRMLLDGHSLFPNHLERLLAAITVAAGRGLAFRSFEIWGFYSRAATEDQLLQQLAAEGLQNVDSLRLVDSPALLPFLSRVSLPRLCHVDLASCWLSIPALAEFIHIHQGSLRSIHLDNTWVLQEKLDDQGIHLSSQSARSIQDHLGSLFSASGVKLTMN
ncbi:hypothetical protein BJX64DRAFT_301203 [Aspergillus heterothallicus]